MATASIWTCTVIVMAVAATLSGLYLSVRQRASVLAHRSAVPKRFAGHVSLAAHQKAAAYTLAKLSLGNLSSGFGLILLILWTFGGGLDALDHGLRLLAWSDVWSGVALLVTFFLIGHIIEMPLDIYATFAIEAHFGFNKMTPALYISDMFKQLMLMLMIGVPLAWLILTLMQGAGSLWWLYAWGVWTAFTLMMMWAYPTLIAPLFNKFRPLEEGELKSRIEALLDRCGFKSSGLFIMDGSRRSSHGNAYFTGLGNAKRIVFFDTLINKLESSEVEAVLAHELGHFRHGHVRKRLLSMTAASLIGFATLGWLVGEKWFYAGLGISQPSNAMALLLFMLVLPAFTFMLAPLFNYFSRKHEFQADAYAVANSGGEALSTALVKMYEDNASTLTPDSIYSAWNDSHPPAPLRIAHIEALSGKFG
ncbi:MAG TPA: M48 family metallopeptidase [Mariprofundaceae bacterium]|jgi:STE24 endopeptidase|nr:M48 family metallopeptidase [Mariprofundaceae bacterium]